MFGSKTFHLSDDEPGDELGSWLSQFISFSFFHRKNGCFFLPFFASFKVKFLKKKSRKMLFARCTNYLNKENSNS